MLKTGSCFRIKDTRLSLYLIEKFRRKKFGQKKKKETEAETEN